MAAAMNRELNTALSWGKRIVPVVCRESDDLFKKARKEIAQMNWIFFSPDANDFQFKQSMDMLIKTLDKGRTLPRPAPPRPSPSLFLSRSLFFFLT
jgi:hypothetical protein